MCTGAITGRTICSSVSITSITLFNIKKNIEPRSMTMLALGLINFIIKAIQAVTLTSIFIFNAIIRD